MPLIKIQGLTKLYRMGDSIVHALDGVDLEIERGEFIAITGASGSGKSTIMHLLGCLDRPTGGDYLLDGRNVGEMSDRELARIRNKSIGFVFQTFNLINRTTALENVGIPLFYARRAQTHLPARRALERVGLAERITHTPAELSGGERQRVAIARAIVNDPLLVLADEPTGNLDTRTGQQIIQIFRTLNEQGVTVVLVTHEQEVAMQTERIVQMRDGKIVSDRLTADIQADTGVPGASAPVARSAVELSAASGAVPASAEAATPGEVPPGDAGSPAAREALGMTARLAEGTNAAFGCGLAAPLLLLVAAICTLIVVRKAAELGPIGPQNPLPASLGLLTLALVLALLLSIAAGFIGFFWGRAVLRRIRTVPGTWIGAGRARAAWICGLVTILIPLALVLTNIVACMLRGPRT